MTSMAPGQVATPLSLLTPERLAVVSDDELAHTAAAVLAEQHRRALLGSDLDALLEEGFVLGFSGDGHPNIPWISNGFLFCPGYIRFKSATSHECTFTSVDGSWSWQHADVVVDNMRQVPAAKTLKNSISILTLREGMEVDVVSATSKGGAACQMRKATSYQVRLGELVQVSTRARAASKGGHG